MERKAIDSKATLLMTLLCATWGMQQVAMKAASPDMAPVFQVAIRSGIAACLVFLLLLYRRETGAITRETWKPGLLVGTLFALEFLFVGEGLRFTSASHMSIFLYTAPIFTALGLHFKLPEERLKAVQWCGIVLAFLGVVTSFAGRAPEGGAALHPNAWLGDLLGIGAGMALGATTLSIRFSRLASTPATGTLLYQLLGAFGWLLGAAVLLNRTTFTVSSTLLTSLGFQTVIVSFGSFLMWFALLRTYLASRLSILTFMTPVFGVAFGTLVLGEKLDASFILGALMVLAGLVLVSGRELLQKRRLVAGPNRNQPSPAPR